CLPEDETDWESDIDSQIDHHILSEDEAEMNNDILLEDYVNWDGILADEWDLVFDSLPARVEKEEWTTISSGKPQKSVPAGSNEKRQRTIKFADPQKRQGPPSAASHARRSIYAQPAKAESYHKQSCLPLEERDADLVEVEANKGRVYKKYEYRPGMIIRGLLHEQDYIATSKGSNITISDRNRTDSRYGPICTKWRKMIILGIFQDHYTAIPLFTHNGNGLANKQCPDEFVSIRDHRAKEKSPRQSKHPPLLTETMNSGIDLFDIKSAAHVTYTLSRKFELPVIMEGCLDRRSLNRLVELFKQYAPKYEKDRDGKIPK
ncbi:MAG: hypothetical protein Q9183_002774, partial [Haloplaca sp. 2 TL-2023]